MPDPSQNTSPSEAKLAIAVATQAPDVTIENKPLEDRSKISVYPPFGYAPTKTSPSVRPRVIVRELPPTPHDFRRDWRLAEIGNGIFWLLVAAGIAHRTATSLASTAVALALYVIAVKTFRWYARSGRMLAPVSARDEPPPPLAGIRSTVFDRIQYAFVKVPLQNCRAFRLGFLTLPWTALKLALQYARKGGYRSPITDEDCWNLLVTTACLVPAVLSDDGAFLDLTAPDDLPLVTPQGLSVAGVSMRFEVATHRILYCKLDGADVKDDKEIVAAIIHALLVGWCHAKSHLASEAAAREIRNAGATVVSPCSAFTFSLHEYLVYSHKGPLQTDWQAGVRGISIYQATAIPMPHALDPRKAQFRYYELLFKARLIVRRLVHKYSVPVSGELLFNTCVVHSLDHLNCYRWAHGRTWSFDLSKTFSSRVLSVWFTEFYVQPMVHPFYSEYLKDERSPFYTELYTELRALDETLANSLLLSTSY